MSDSGEGFTIVDHSWLYGRRADSFRGCTGKRRIYRLTARGEKSCLLILALDETSRTYRDEKPQARQKNEHHVHVEAKGSNLALSEAHREPLMASYMLHPASKFRKKYIES